jgi:hypothetical protein
MAQNPTKSTQIFRPNRAVALQTALIETSMGRMSVDFWLLENADVLPPGQGRAVGVDVVGFMPVGSDVLLAFEFHSFNPYIWNS